MASKIINGCLVIFAAFLCPLSVIIAAGGGAIITSVAQPADVNVQFHSPASTSPDTEFTVSFSLINEAESTRTLAYIDLLSGALEGVEILNVTPDPSSTSRDPLFQNYWFWLEIPPGDTLDVVFEIVAHQSGRHELLFGICVHYPLHCPEFEAVIEVR